MEEDQEAEMTGLSGLWLQAVSAAQSQLARIRSQTLLPRTNLWTVFALGVVCSLCQVEGYFSAGGLLFLCLVWALLAAAAHVLKRLLHFRPGPREVKEEQYSQLQSGSSTFSLRPAEWIRPGHHSPLALVLADSLLLCVLQEPLEGPSVTQIQAQLVSLQSVCQNLEEADSDPAEAEEVEESSRLTEKVRLIFSYLQQRILLLSELVEVQSSLETSVGEVQPGLDRLWTQLEEMHTGVTLFKKGEQQGRELPSAQADVKIMLTEVDQYRKKLQQCQSHLKDAIRVLQELTWSHANTSQAVKGSIESVWPEKLLQSNIEQFDKLQEGFLSLEQQTLTFQAHLEGLGRDSEESETSLSTASLQDQSQDCPNVQNEPLSDTSSLSLSSADVDEDVDKDTRQSLCERSTRPFSTTIGRLHKSRRRK